MPLHSCSCIWCRARRRCELPRWDRCRACLRISTGSYRDSRSQSGAARPRTAKTHSYKSRNWKKAAPFAATAIGPRGASIKMTMPAMTRLSERPSLSLVGLTSRGLPRWVHRLLPPLRFAAREPRSATGRGPPMDYLDNPLPASIAGEDQRAAKKVRISTGVHSKTHSYWNVVENKRLDGGRVVQRHVLYLGEINSSQAAAWRKAIEVFDVDAGRARTLSLFPEDRCEAITGDASVVQLRLSEMQLRRPRQWGACWLAGQLWQELQLDRFWADRLLPSRKRTPWDQILQVLATYRLIAPGSEWRLHREWFGNSAMADLLGADFGR